MGRPQAPSSSCCEARMISEDVLERLARGPCKGLRNWPAMMPHVRAGLVRMTSLGGRLAQYELTDRGRRKQNAYKFKGAGL